MDIKDVIGYFSDEAHCLNYDLRNGNVIKSRLEYVKNRLEATQLALSALEKQEAVEVANSKCEYCCEIHERHSPNSIRRISANCFTQVKPDDFIDIEVPVNYCPNCGQRIKEVEG